MYVRQEKGQKRRENILVDFFWELIRALKSSPKGGEKRTEAAKRIREGRRLMRIWKSGSES